jgi:hypothetical protein
VQDSGPGFSLESFDRLFEPFYATKGRGHGYGTFDLPVDRRCSWGTNMGLAHCWPRRSRSVHSVDTRQTSLATGASTIEPGD